MPTPALNLFLQNVPWQQNAKITGMPFGYIPFVLSNLLARHQKPILLVLRDEKEIEQIQTLFACFASDIPTLVFPAWDCVPYDQLSPRPDISATRMKTLSQLKKFQTMKNSAPFVLLTTPEAFVQKVPLPASFSSQTLHLCAGNTLSVEAITAFCEAQGYRRVDTVYEPGDYAQRGGIIDLFPSDAEWPVRIDMFGDEIESIKNFDPATQRSLDIIKELDLGSVSELPFSAAAIDRFRFSFREQFGIQSLKSSKVQGILAGRHIQGVEHWLPLFYEGMGSLHDFIPVGTQILTLVDDLKAQCDAFLQEISDNFKKRTHKLSDDDEPYHALPSTEMYLAPEDFEHWIENCPLWVTLPSSDYADPAKGYFNAGGVIGYNFTAERALRVQDGEKVSLYQHVVDYILKHKKDDKNVILTATSKARLLKLEDALKDVDPSLRFAPYEATSTKPNKTINTAILSLDSGFVSENICCLTDADILGAAQHTKVKKRSRKSPEELLSELSNFSEGDYIVHAEHGIGKYMGLKTLSINNAVHDFIDIHYADGDKLLVPIEHMSAITKFGSSDGKVTLDRLGSTSWQTRRAKVKKRLMEIADKLIKTAAVRQTETTDVWRTIDGIYDEFCLNFPYELTPDQQQAEDDVLEDFARGIPMDRLICGDVGFGKTEVALRAAFLAAYHKKQVCVVVPTTLLCRQHYHTFSKRFAPFGVKVAQLSRMVSSTEAKKTKEACANGEVNILIATHAAFGKGLDFKELGLVVLDEEQHFGVVQKESLKKKYPHTHILTLSATPIPRTLQLSLAGVRPMSLIATPPVDRLSVRTFVMPYDSMVVQEALLREFYRGGQSFYVCPRLKDLPGVRKQLQELAPDLKVAEAHGKLKPAALEKIMQAFCDGDYDVLLSTNIVESGIDIPTANTMIVHRADMFGLSQLYQLRGRVGRGKLRGYAYFTLSPGKTLSDNAKKRLKVMQSLDALGAGFSIASHDMDIRGAGNLVGEAQAGHIKEVGVELYQQMLKEAVDTIKAQSNDGNTNAEIIPSSEFLPQISIGTDAYIPEHYIQDLDLRLRLYRRLSNCFDSSDLPNLEDEFIDRFGPLPIEVKNLFELISLKIIAASVGVDKIEVGPKGAIFSFYKNMFSNPLGLVNYITEKKGLLKLRPDHKLAYLKPMRDIESRYPALLKILKELLVISQVKHDA